MRIAIHNRPGSFSDRWIEYCQEKGIDYKVVNAYDSDIICQISDCDAFMFHHHHGNYKDVLFARQLLYSLEESGKRVFPDWRTCWHFDDKVGQKYLLEAIGAPLIPSYVFYTEKEALNWIRQTTFPKSIQTSRRSQRDQCEARSYSQRGKEFCTKSVWHRFLAICCSLLHLILFSTTKNP